MAIPGSNDWRLLAIQAWCQDNCDFIRRVFALPGANINAEFQSYGGWTGNSGALYYDSVTSSDMNAMAKGKLMLLKNGDTLLDVSHRNKKSDNFCGCIRSLGGMARNTMLPSSAARSRPQAASPPAVPVASLPAVAARPRPQAASPPAVPTASLPAVAATPADAHDTKALVKLAESIAALDVDNTTPIAALNQLTSLKRQAANALAQQPQKSQRTSRRAVSLDASIALTPDLRALVSEGSLTLEQAVALK